MAEVMESEYRGNAMLVIRQGEGDKFPVQFGVRKAKMILAHIPDIEKFVAKHQA